MTKFNLKKNIEHEKELARQLGSEVYCAVVRMEVYFKKCIRLLKEETPEFVSDPEVKFSRIALHEVLDKLSGGLK